MSPDLPPAAPLQHFVGYAQFLSETSKQGGRSVAFYIMGFCKE